MLATPQFRRFAALSRRRLLPVMVCAYALAIAAVASAEPATVRYAGKTITVKETLDDPRDLWVQPADLTRINGFVLKPEGACLEDICIPIRQDRDSDVLITRRDVKWVNLGAFARKIGQKVTADYDTRIWTFGPLPFKTTGASPAATKKGPQ
jgi:hypothetical protein